MPHYTWQQQDSARNSFGQAGGMSKMFPEQAEVSSAFLQQPDLTQLFAFILNPYQFLIFHSFPSEVYMFMSLAVTLEEGNCNFQVLKTHETALSNSVSITHFC